MRLAGVDGARIGKVNGWLVALGNGLVPDKIRFCGSAAELLGIAEITAIDIPIGLPESGTRRCDIEARKVLSGRGSTVFPVPVRSIVEAPSVAAAYDRARDLGGPLPTPFFMALRPRILEVDALIRHDPGLDWYEVHPEVSFAVMTGGPMPISKHKPEGLQLRRDALARAIPGIELDELAPEKAKADDVYDCLAAYWTAFRIATGQEVQLPSEIARDGCGIPMVIRA